MIGLSLCGCAKEDPAKAEMQAMAGENQEITGAYDEALAFAAVVLLRRRKRKKKSGI